MTVAIPPIPPLPPLNAAPEASAAATGANGPSVSGTGFMDHLGQAIDALQQGQTNVNTQSMAVADGSGNISTFMVAAEQANLQMELTDTLAQKATAAFNMIMDMSF